MVRKTKEDAEKTRLGILDAALDLIYEQGYSATNLNDIAEKLGMTRGAVYWHFKNKQELFLSLIKNIDGQLDLQLTRRARKVSSLDDLYDFFLYYAEIILTDDRNYKYLTVLTMKIEWNAELEEVVNIYQKQTEELEGFCYQILKKAAKKKKLKPEVDIELTSRALIAVVDGCLHTTVPPFGNRNVDVLRQALNLFFVGIKLQ